MKHLKNLGTYLYNSLTGSFIGFVVGMAATSLVSRFFETRSFKNLWGLTAKKKLVDKETFGFMEWAISIVIGFLVFELFQKVVKPKLELHMPRYKMLASQWMARTDIPQKLKTGFFAVNKKTMTLLSSAYLGTKNGIERFSKK